jgi:hypothetical protein
MREQHVRRSVKEQIQNGLRLGGGLGVFLIGALLLGQARTRLEVLSSHNQPGWSDWVVMLEVILGIGLLFSTAHVWYQLLAGCLIFGAVKGLIALLMGREIFPLRQVPATHIASLTVIAYCIATLLLMARFMDRKPTMVDRIAFTCFFLCLLPTGSFPSVWPIVGLAALLLSWAVYRWRKRRAPTGGAPGETAAQRVTL